MKKIALIPIDNRPVCFLLPEEISKIDDDLSLIMPKRSLLGDLKNNADSNSICEWLKGLKNIDAVVISLDTIAYGGLIPSRRSSESLNKIKKKLEKLKTILKEKNTKIYAFSSIMRISNNNVNEEEKEYWDKYGKVIFEYSYHLHRFGKDKGEIPPAILKDYLTTRSRNFEINKMYLDWLEEGVFDSLVFSKDDCAEFGLNVLEAKELAGMIAEKDLPACVKTGADEIPLTLLARAVCDINANNKVKIAPIFLEPEHKDLISKYEDISIEKSVLGQIELSGAQIADMDEADIMLIINNFKEVQGEIVMGVGTESFSSDLILPQRPYMLADVRFANGADNRFVDKFFENTIDFEKFFGFSAWNTSANSLGSLICAAIVRFFANQYNEGAFKNLQLTRFLDDWAYQANVRQELKLCEQLPDVVVVKKKMIEYEKILNDKIGINSDINYRFPWNRFFEIEVLK